MKPSRLSCLAVILCASATWLPGSGAAPSCELTHVDKCVATVFFFAQNTSAATDPNIVSWDCKQEVAAVECLTEYAASTCVSGITKGVLKLIIEGAAQESVQKCDPGHTRNQEYYKYLPCINKAGVKLNQCMKEATSYAEAAGKKPSNLRVPHMCCGFANLINCLKSAAAATCDEDHVSYVQSIIEGVAGDMLDTICAKYKFGSPSCNRLGKLKIAKTHKFNTVVPPMIEILSSL